MSRAPMRSDDSNFSTDLETVLQNQTAVCVDRGHSSVNNNNSRLKYTYSTTKWLFEVLADVPSSQKRADLALDVLAACQQQNEVEISDALINILGVNSGSMDAIFLIVPRAKEISERVTAEDIRRFSTARRSYLQSSCPDTFMPEEPNWMHEERAKDDELKVEKKCSIQAVDPQSRSKYGRNVETDVHEQEEKHHQNHTRGEYGAASSADINAPPTSHSIGASPHPVVAQQNRIGLDAVLQPSDQALSTRGREIPSSVLGDGATSANTSRRQRPGAYSVYPSGYRPPSGDSFSQEASDAAHREEDVAIPIAAYVVQDSGSHTPSEGSEKNTKGSWWRKKRCLALILPVVIVVPIAAPILISQHKPNPTPDPANPYIAASACTMSTDCNNGLLCDNSTNACVQCLKHGDCFGTLPFCHMETKKCSECLHNSDCDDSIWCNGIESCRDRRCVAGSNPCSGKMPICDEESRSCVECLKNMDCPGDLICVGETCKVGTPCTEAGDCEGHGSFCNTIQCMQGLCAAGAEPCSRDRPFCIEDARQCVECIGLGHCENSKFCEPESCTDGFCVSGSSPCPEQRPFCVEDAKDCFECIEDVHCQDSGSFCSPKVCTGGFCTDGTDPCPPERPYCDEDTMTCFECTSDSQCPDNGSFCEPNICQNGHCNTGSSPCSGSRPICDEGAKTCVECIDDNHCPSQIPFCDQDTSTCKECIHDYQCDNHDSFCNPSICQNGACQSEPEPCNGSRPYCNEASNECNECIRDSNCSNGSFCNPSICKNGACRASGSTPCSGPKPYCDEENEKCVECRDDGDCSESSKHCHSSKCVECEKNSDCEGSFCNPRVCKDNDCKSLSDPCGGSRPFCSESREKCLECRKDSHCGESSACRSHECNNGECDSKSKDCNDGHCSNDLGGCVDCLNDGHCDSDEKCSRGECVSSCSEEMRFKSHESTGDDWLYATGSDVRADDRSYTYWKHCGEALVSQSSGTCLTRIYPGDNHDEFDVELARCDGDKDQQWKIEKKGSYYKIRNPAKNCCLDVFRGDTSAGGKEKDVDCIACNEADQGNDQLWNKFR